MKSASAAMKAHIAGRTTTLCTCWKVVRTDGVTLGFTDHDRDLTYEGVFYESQYGYNRSAISNDGAWSVDNLDVTGFLDSELITDADVRNGAFNFAEVYIFAVNWKDLSMGDIKLRRGWFGEAMTTDDGKFTVELRGLTQALAHDLIENFSPECRADFCDSRCTLNIADYTHTATVTDSGDGSTTFTGAAIPPAPTTSTSVGAHKAWAIAAETFPDGSHFGFAEIKFFDQSGNEITGGSTHDDHHDSGHGSSKARDGNPNTYFSVSDVNTLPVIGEAEQTKYTAAGVRWWIIFDEAVDVKEVEMVTTPNLGEAPTRFQLQYTDDDLSDTENKIDANWELAKDCAATWTEGGQSGVWAIGSDTSDPINYATSQTDIAVPFTGASTYIGGTIKWLTGRNTGRVIEITDFDTDSNTVTLFEGTVYPITVGDSFSISQGCDKSVATCSVYKNVLNFRGEPYVPGQDEYLQYPDATS